MKESLDAAENAEKLRSYFRGLGSAAVAFSGGVDSTVLAGAAYEVLGRNALAVTIDSQVMDRMELSAAEDLASRIGIRQVVVKYDALKDPCFVRNDPGRCYYCKKGMVKALKDAVKGIGIKAVVEGTNAEDAGGRRPGYAAVKEAGVLSPLAELGFSKKDVRGIAAYMGLLNADRPSTACLASRIPYGTEVTAALLVKVSKAESAVRAEGVKQLRVRSIGDIAVIEVMPEDFGRVLSGRDRITAGLRSLGYKRIVLDLAGYSTGSMDP